MKYEFTFIHCEELITTENYFLFLPVSEHADVS